MINEISVSALRRIEFAKLVAAGKLSLRYTAAPGYFSHKNDKASQDALKIIHGKSRVGFAMCDGVSGSFFGDIAAKLLATHLADFMNKNDFASGVDLEISLNHELNELSKTGKGLVLDFEFGDDIEPFLAEILEEKRDSGSASMFVCGKVSLSEKTRESKIQIAWLGDTRIRLWPQSLKRGSHLNTDLKKTESWSTHGTRGDEHINTYFSNSKTFERLLVYTDGFSVLDEEDKLYSNAWLNDQIEFSHQQAESDDISFLEIWRTSENPKHLVVPRQIDLSPRVSRRGGKDIVLWKKIPGAKGYQLEILGEAPRRINTKKPIYYLAGNSGKETQFRVRVLFNKKEPSAWSPRFGTQIEGGSTSSIASETLSFFDFLDMPSFFFFLIILGVIEALVLYFLYK